MPVYNAEDLLPETLDSVLSQTFDDFEVVISDNASTDSTPDICRAFAELSETGESATSATSLTSAYHRTSIEPSAYRAPHTSSGRRTTISYIRTSSNNVPGFLTRTRRRSS